MIEFKRNLTQTNPIRKHIGLSFDRVGSDDERINEVVKVLKSNNFDPSKSKVLIFVGSRNGCEEANKELNSCLIESKHPSANRTQFYHAGLDAIQREERYEDYKNDRLDILIATKAFGMGMDIKNIHFVFHIGPSATFEDFLQEIGRAGRDPNLLNAAGYSDSKKLITKCLLTNDDFAKLKDRNHKNQITWLDLGRAFNTIINYISQFRDLESTIENPFPLPLDLIDNDEKYDEVLNKDTFLRVCLYWLEKLGRVSLGLYTPTHFPFLIILDQTKNIKIFKNSSDRDKAQLIQNEILRLKSLPENSEKVMIGMESLKHLIAENRKSEVMRILFLGQNSGMFKIDRNIKFEVTKLRSASLKRNYPAYHPTILATMNLAQKLIELVPFGKETAFTSDEIEDLGRKVVSDIFIIKNLNWKEPKLSSSIQTNPLFYTAKDLRAKLIEDFITKRAKFAFRILSFLPGVKHKSTIKIDKHTGKASTINLLYNGNKNTVLNTESLKTFTRDLTKFVEFVAEYYFQNNVEKFNLIDLINELELSIGTERHFQHIMFIARALGYIRGDGNIASMGIELGVLNFEKLDALETNNRDSKIQQEFKKVNRMKLLRLLALECLASISNQRQEAFIVGYFQCKEESDILMLMDEHFGSNHPSLAAFREEALQKAKEELNPDQKAIYDSALNKNLQVIAGPGTGKTKTLTLRVARLIQEENVRPEKILILAYNKAVVLELKSRLSELFAKLGYHRIINRLNVFTFHGYAKYCLEDSLNDTDFDKWIPILIDKIKTNNIDVLSKIGTINYLLVDEFQDITGERLRFLKQLSTVNKLKMTVIGDPNQSIYGYERSEQGDQMSPVPLYKKFQDEFRPINLHLSINYRSYPEILNVAQDLLSKNSEEIKLPKIRANSATPLDFVPVRILGNENWNTELKSLTSYIDQDGNKLQQIAIMFRSNNEVYKAFNLIQDLSCDTLRIRIQGAKGALVKTREFHFFLSSLNSKLDEYLNTDFIKEFKSLRDKKMEERSNWDLYLLDLFLCILKEFGDEKKSTYAELKEFVWDLSSKDDGHFGKIYDKNISKVSNKTAGQEVVLTTMHKVKGLEFDAVLIPSSITDLAKTNDTSKIDEILEEERRLYYVAYTRAKRKLTVIKHKREEALDNNVPFSYQKAAIDKAYGFFLEEGIQKFKLFWGASKYGESSYDLIDSKIKIGSVLTLNRTLRSVYTFWEVRFNNQTIAQLSTEISKRLPDTNCIYGFIISAVYVSTYEETLKSDEINDTKFASKWNQESIDRGYIYIIDFSGFGKYS
ncbi:UvrD-helicase domain-containing protein [Nonlabens antarcticus]|uniref:UvrD-helicase domain-containing protein n=1 Tax=Nonlabens antarcticus TaxID=392714 RepID=UPI001890E226|nr:UvrD-helicase domain-containing protein [Nonlabens antarcticus]